MIKVNNAFAVETRHMTAKRLDLFSEGAAPAEYCPRHEPPTDVGPGQP
jgi:hypothetical protein